MWLSPTAIHHVWLLATIIYTFGLSGLSAAEQIHRISPRQVLKHGWVLLDVSPQQSIALLLPAIPRTSLVSYLGDGLLPGLVRLISHASTIAPVIGIGLEAYRNWVHVSYETAAQPRFYANPSLIMNPITMDLVTVSGKLSPSTHM